MASIVIKALGTATVASLASSKVAVFSKGSVSVYQEVGKPNHPPVWNLLGTSTNTKTVYSITAASNIRIDAGGSDALYEVGVDATITDLTAFQLQGTPGVLNATGTLTAAMILSGLVTSTSAAAVAATLDTGTVLDASLLNMQIGESFDWSVINTGPSTLTVTAAASGHTVVGTMTVVTAVSAAFRTRKTAAATYVTYRLS